MKKTVIILTIAAVTLIALLISWNIRWMSNFNTKYSAPPSVSTGTVKTEKQEAPPADRSVKLDSLSALQENTLPSETQSGQMVKQEPLGDEPRDVPDSAHPAVETEPVSPDTRAVNVEEKAPIDDAPRRNTAAVKQESRKFAPDHDAPLRITIGSRGNNDRHYDRPSLQSSPGLTISGNAPGQHPTSTSP